MKTNCNFQETARQLRMCEEGLDEACQDISKLKGGEVVGIIKLLEACARIMRNYADLLDELRPHEEG